MARLRLAAVALLWGALLWGALAGWALAAGCGESAAPSQPTSSGGVGGAGAGAGGAAAGGQTSSGGAGGSGGSGGAAVPSGGWLPVPWLASCDGERLDLETESWPVRQWHSCGTGCLETDALNIAGQAIASRFGSGASVAGGEIYYRTSTHSDDEDFEVLERLSDGAAFLVLRLDSKCNSSARKTDAPFVIGIADFDGPGVTRFIGRFEHATGALLGAGPYQISSSHPSWFTFTEGWGLIDGGSIRVALDPAVAELTTVHVTNDWQAPARGRGDLVAWIDWSVVPSPIRSWTLAGGNKMLVSQPWDVVTVALGEDTIAWVGATGAETVLGKYDTARLYWSPFSGDPAAISVTEGPDLTGLVAGGLEPAVAGDYITSNTWHPGAEVNGVIVVRMSTQQLWFILPRPGTRLVPQAISATEILATETDLSSKPNNFDRYLRLELSALDTFAQGWPEP